MTVFAFVRGKMSPLAFSRCARGCILLCLSMFIHVSWVMKQGSISGPADAEEIPTFTFKLVGSFAFSAVTRKKKKV